jgi:hypothetical protein
MLKEIIIYIITNKQNTYVMDMYYQVHIIVCFYLLIFFMFMYKTYCKTINSKSNGGPSGSIGSDPDGSDPKDPDGSDPKDPDSNSIGSGVSNFFYSTLAYIGTHKAQIAIGVGLFVLALGTYIYFQDSGESVSINNIIDTSTSTSITDSSNIISNSIVSTVSTDSTNMAPNIPEYPDIPEYIKEIIQHMRDHPKYGPAPTTTVDARLVMSKTMYYVAARYVSWLLDTKPECFYTEIELSPAEYEDLVEKLTDIYKDYFDKNYNPH